MEDDAINWPGKAEKAVYSVYGLYNVVTVVPHWCSVSKRQCRLGLISMEINFLQDVNFFFFLPFYLFLTFTNPSNCF